MKIIKQTKRNSMAAEKKISREEEQLFVNPPLRRSPRVQSRRTHSTTTNPKSPSPTSTPKSNRRSTPLRTKSTPLRDDFDAISSLRRSPQFSYKEKFVSDKVNHKLGQKVTKKNELQLGLDEVSCVRRSPRFWNTKMSSEKEKSKCGTKNVKNNELKPGVDEVSCVRRSPRFAKIKMCSDKEKTKCGEKILKKNDVSFGVGDVLCIRRSPRFSNTKMCSEKEKSKRSIKIVKNNEVSSGVDEVSCVRRSPRFSNTKMCSEKEKSKRSIKIVKNNEVSSGVDEVSCVRRSPRFSNTKMCSEKEKSKRSIKIVKNNEVSSGVDEVSCVRRSPRFSNTKMCSEKEKSKRSIKIVKNNEVSSGVDEVSCVRRSPRFSNTKMCSEKEKSKRSIKIVKNNEVSSGVDEVSCVRRSPRFSNTKMCSEKEKSKRSIKIVKNNEVSSGVDEVSCVRRSPRFECKGNPKKLVVKAKRVNELKRGGVESSSVGINVVKKEIGIKRKREMKDRVSATNGWTKEEEVALQRAYFSVKPTPHFWNKVAKLVPGKSANDCFSKVHSDQSTPRQTQPRRRVNKVKPSPLGMLSLSASKLLKQIGRNTKKPSYCKKKARVAHRTVRHLLRNHYNVDQDHEADLFSVLEPKIQASTQKLTHSLLFSTPRNDIRKSRLLEMSCEASSSTRTKPLSRFSNLCPIPLSSPPVLKQVKNKALHEKYIDHLHTREAKRKAVSTWNSKATARIPSLPDNYKKMDKLKANLVTSAKDAVGQLTQLRANDSVNSSELGGDGLCTTDTDDELEDGT